MVPSLLDGPPGTNLFSVLQRELNAAPKRRLSVAFLDVDDHTGFNYLHGRDAGTRALERIADVLAALGPDTIAGRYGGDEFAVVLPGSGARAAAWRLRRAAAHIWRVAGGPHRRPVRVSAGGVTSWTGSTPAALMAAAHTALVAAKESGGNRVVWAPGTSSRSRRRFPS